MMEILLGWRWAALKNGLLDSMAYRAEFFIGTLGNAAGPLVIQMLVWSALYGGHADRTIGGVGLHDMMKYTVFSVLFSQIRGGDLDFELSEMIRTGALSQYLLRPVSAIQFVFSRGTATKLLMMVLCLVTGSILAPFADVSVGRFFNAMILALLGNLIHFQISAALSAAAFYWEEAYSVLLVKNMIVSLLSGELIPLFLVPAKWSWIWKITPFYLYVYGPTEYTLGHWSHLQFIQALGLAVFWAIAARFMIKLTWGLGMRRYLSLGG